MGGDEMRFDQNNGCTVELRLTDRYHNITDSFESPDCPYTFTSILKQLLKSRHPTTLHNG